MDFVSQKEVTNNGKEKSSKEKNKKESGKEKSH